MSNITHTMRGNNCIADNCNETREWAEAQGHTIVEADQAGRRDYYQNGRSQLLHIVIAGEAGSAPISLCDRDMSKAGRLANDVDDAPICTHCIRKLDKLRD